MEKKKTYKKTFYEVQFAPAKLVPYFELQKLLNSPYSCYANFLEYDEWPKSEEARKIRHPLAREYVQSVFCEDESAIDSNIKMCKNGYQNQ